MREGSKSQDVRRLVVVLLAAVALCTGCASTPIPVQSGHYTSGRILLLPPRDLVQNGVPHHRGVGSGKIFQGYLKQNFLNTPFEVVTTDDNAFGTTQIAEKSNALKEAKQLNADYCLQVVLGEFLNAAPMTFRPDHASVESAIMYDVTTGDTVWELVAPVYLQKANPGNHFVLLNDHARTIAKSILKNMK
jgi:hypothetical protein